MNTDDSQACDARKRPDEEEDEDGEVDDTSQRNLLAFDVAVAGRDFGNRASSSSLSPSGDKEDVEHHHHHLHEVCNRQRITVQYHSKVSIRHEKTMT